MVAIKLIPREEFRRIEAVEIDLYCKLELLADMNRANTLSAVKKAGSGHLGSSFSAMDIVVWLYYQEMNTVSVGIDSPDRDIFYSSKGHDVPGLYTVFYALGILPQEKLLKLRRLGGLDGHPHVSIPGIEANTGSLGMGIAKGKGMAYAKALQNWGGRVFVMTGDGELQEGQIYESLQTAVHQGITNLNVIIDHNKVQSDKLVDEITDLGNLEDKLGAFGWHIARCDGHDYKQLEKVLAEFKSITDKPKILIADTIKGRGVSFMEHPVALDANEGLYAWHSGAPDDDSFLAAFEEIVGSINSRLDELGLSPVKLELVSDEKKVPSGVTRQFVAEAYGQALVDLARERKDLVVLDADLAADCRIRDFEMTYPERFIENGIAEQDMVSMAGGLARQGLLPVVNTFSSFLAARANEQIYNNAGEGTKIIYACHYAGLIPAGPGLSHQSIRDISLFGALSNFEILQPCNNEEARMVTEYCVNTAKENCMIRLIISPSPRNIELPANYQLEPGKGVALSEGEDAVLFAYGPVMVNEALIAAEILAEDGFGLKVVNMPWLNRVDTAWLKVTISATKAIYVMEDHAPVGGLGDFLLYELVASQLLGDRTFEKFAVEGFPAWGTPPEVLNYHGLDGATIASRIKVE